MVRTADAPASSLALIREGDPDRVLSEAEALTLAIEHVAAHLPASGFDDLPADALPWRLA